MPEFLFRRKKQQSRSKEALNDVQESQPEPQGAKQQTKKKEKDKVSAKAATRAGDGGGARVATLTLGKEVERNDSILREREQFMALYKNKYPEDAARLGLTNGRGELEVKVASQEDMAKVNGAGEEATMTNHVNGGSDNLAPLVSWEHHKT